MYRARAAVVAEIEAELVAVVASAVQGVRDAIPVYHNLHGPQLADVEAIAYWSLRRLMTLWAGGDPAIDERDHSRFRAIGAARAADGRPLADVLRAYRVASSVFVRHVATKYLDALDPPDIADLSLGVLDAIDAISEEIIGAYIVAREQLTSNRAQAHALLLDDLLAGRHNSPGAVADRARELDLELPSHPNLLVVEPTSAGRSLTDDTVESLVLALGLAPPDRTAPSTTRNHLCTRREQRAILLLPSTIGRAQVDVASRASGVRGCLMERSTVAGVGSAWRLASEALDTAPDHAFDGRAVLDTGDGQLLALLTARPTADTSEVVRTVLGSLTESANAHILEGLSAFIATGTATAAASQLHVHPQTLRYRLRRAQELTGRDPRSAWHRLALDTAIQLRQLG
ncbi:MULTISPECIES: PucR family transcriptional regulator [unclassified Rhodococcus (in: high G+C Gram-positive bacteria)]|uniref:PucR family transcriptional regulator n=1 Tax=unclassified Rhodococcus (in: high G+C Gram-positive bacteria) TaxID=192944 RepID=UPI00117B020A|nr:MULTISPECIES: helix-turn-helix domain-containing protein [unclassified Rhodococcus (in: high G+C Gram-positive bacteria)]